MTYPHRTRTQTILDGSTPSTITSNALLVADYRTQTLSWTTVTGSASTLTVQGSLVNGATAAIAEGTWSTLTTVTAQGIFTVPILCRYLRVGRPNADSASSIVFHGVY